MAAQWTLQYKGTLKLLADWPVSKVRRVTRSLDVDTLTFFGSHGNVDPALKGTANAQFQYGEQVVLRRDGVKWFVGTLMSPTIVLEGSAEFVQYTAVGPWWHLERLVFQRLWRAYRNGAGALSEVYSSHILLFLNSNNTLASVATQVTEVISRAATQGVQIQAAAALDLPITPPIDEVRDLTCAEVIQRAFRWHPDAVGYFDYSTDPYPTFNAKRRANLNSVTLESP